VTGIFTLFSGGGNAGSDSTPTNTIKPTTPTNTARTTKTSKEKVHPEQADNRSGITAFTDTSGSVSDKPKIQFGAWVNVLCVAPKTTSELGSITAFYKIADGPWRGLYVPANTFANGDALGDETANTTVDPSVPQC
jgi:hypothetical protein